MQLFFLFYLYLILDGSAAIFNATMVAKKILLYFTVLTLVYLEFWKLLA